MGALSYQGPTRPCAAWTRREPAVWTTLAQRDGISRSYGSHAFYDIGKILVSGGGASVRDSRTIDLNGPTPQVSATSPMAFGRRQHNLTTLADGSVLATGGNSSGALARRHERGRLPRRALGPCNRYLEDARLDGRDASIPLHGAASARRPRLVRRWRHLRDVRPGRLPRQECRGLHATVPLPEGRLGPARSAADDQLGAELGRLRLAVQIGTPDAASIGKVALVRLGAVTHSVNMEQRYVPLSFTAGSSSLDGDRPDQRRRGAAGLLHAVHP